MAVSGNNNSTSAHTHKWPLLLIMLLVQWYQQSYSGNHQTTSPTVISYQYPLALTGLFTFTYSLFTYTTLPAMPHNNKNSTTFEMRSSTYNVAYRLLIANRTLLNTHTCKHHASTTVWHLTEFSSCDCACKCSTQLNCAILQRIPSSTSSSTFLALNNL